MLRSFSKLYKDEEKCYMINEEDDEPKISYKKNLGKSDRKVGNNHEA